MLQDKEGPLVNLVEVLPDAAPAELPQTAATAATGDQPEAATEAVPVSTGAELQPAPVESTGDGTTAAEPASLIAAPGAAVLAVKAAGAVLGMQISTAVHRTVTCARKAGKTQ